MSHWKRVLSLNFVEVRYEDMVSNLESTAKTMIDACGLDWESSCLDFMNTSRAVRTPSRLQVRQGVHSGSVGYWTRYAKMLTTLDQALKDCGF